MAERSLPATRELRGLELYRTQGDEITRIWAHTYSVPSCTGEKTYIVRLDRGTCDCPDYERHEASCKHMFAATIKASKARAKVSA